MYTHTVYNTEGNPLYPSWTSRPGARHSPARTGRERGGDGGGKVTRRGETAEPAGVGEESKKLPHPVLSDLLHGGGLPMSGPLHGCGQVVPRFTRLIPGAFLAHSKKFWLRLRCQTISGESNILCMKFMKMSGGASQLQNCGRNKHLHVTVQAHLNIAVRQEDL